MTDQQLYELGAGFKRTRQKLAGVMIGILLLLFLAPTLNVFAEEQAASSYVVKSGDCLYSIAKNILGSGDRWKELYEKNKASISNPSLIFPGQTLTLPGTETGQTVVAAQPAAEQTNTATQTATGQANTAAQPSEARARQIAKEYLARAAAEEPVITEALKTIECDTCYLQGLENRLKSEDSMTRKIMTNAAEEGITEEEAAARIADGLRYTVCIKEEAYVPTVTEAMQLLTEAGCSIVKFKNYWGGTAYKGINTQLKTPGGYLLEIQFHTPASFNAKEEEHKYYELRRLPDTPPEEVTRLEKLSLEIFQKVPVPQGAPELSWNTTAK